MKDTYASLKETTKAAKLFFYGTPQAELYAKECEESVQGILRKSLTYEGGPGEKGFISSSIDGRFWYDTSWSRDVGVVLRELANLGYLEQACLIAENNLWLIDKNENGYYSFPMYFYQNQKQSGTEVDGTASIIIGLCDIWHRLTTENPTKAKVYDFLSAPSSPLFEYINKLENDVLIPGTGEFGAGCGLDTDVTVYNVVQNNLARLALLASAKLLTDAGNAETAALFTKTAEKISVNMLRYLVDEDGTWIWCVTGPDMKPDPAILNAILNVGFGGINGVGAMNCDVLGFDCFDNGWAGNAICKRTFEKLNQHPIRKQQFEKYGIWTQFEKHAAGLITSPSYGHAYAAQTMLLLGDTESAGKAVAYLADATYNPPPFYHVDRDSPYYFYERYYSLDSEGLVEPEQGCGALNLVNVGEPLKIARLLIGVDNCSTETVRIFPRIPSSWEGYRVEQWSFVTPVGLILADFSYTKSKDGYKFSLKTHDGVKIPSIELFLPHVDKQTKKYAFTDVSEIQI